MLGRRQMLVAAGRVAAYAIAGAVAGGCAPLRTSGKHAKGSRVAVTSVATSGSTVFGTFAPFEYLPSLLSEYHKTHPNINVEPINSLQNGSGRSPFVMEGVFGGYLGAIKAELAPLDSALKTNQFDAGSLLPGARDAFAVHGQTVGLPLAVQPCAVMWRPDVFSEAGLQTPDPNWTWADFVSVCNVLQSKIASGDLKTIQWALGPMTGQYNVAEGGKPLTQWWGASHIPGLWQAFVLGYGGEAVVNGRFALANAKVMQGLEQFVSVATRFSLPTSQVPTTPAGMQNFTERYALAFSFYVPDVGPPGPSLAPSYTKGWQFARLPRFPVRPIVTTSFLGDCLAYLPSSDAATVDFSQALTQQAADVDAGTDFLTWMYSPAAQSILTGNGFPPVMADGEAQRGFWQRMRRDIRVIGDWENFVYYADGWPNVPPPDIMDSALQNAVGDPRTLMSELMKAEQVMNNWLTSSVVASG